MYVEVVDRIKEWERPCGARMRKAVDLGIFSEDDFLYRLLANERFSYTQAIVSKTKDDSLIDIVSFVRMRDLLKFSDYVLDHMTVRDPETNSMEPASIIYTQGNRIAVVPKSYIKPSLEYLKFDILAQDDGTISEPIF